VAPCDLLRYVGRIPTIVEALEGGQAAGTALAEVLWAQLKSRYIDMFPYVTAGIDMFPYVTARCC